MDVLSDVLRALQLRGTVYFQADFRAPWGMDIKGGTVANFHVVTRGACWLTADVSDAGPDGGPVRHELNEGDIAVFPRGDRHALLHAPDAQSEPAESLMASPRDPSGPVFGGEGRATTLICGHFEYDSAGQHPLFVSLPRLILLRAGASPRARWLGAATQLAVAESGSSEPGATAVVDRLAEALLIQVLRAQAEAADWPAGFIQALADPHLSVALDAMHSSPDYPWSVDELARRAGLSRSGFSARFSQTVALAPMEYLRRWRMQKARDLLGRGERSIAEIAESVGYASEFAFAKRFKSVFGIGPGTFRRTHRSTTSV